MVYRLILLIILSGFQSLHAMGYLDSCVQKNLSIIHVKLWDNLLKGEIRCYSRNDWGEFKLFGPEDLVKASAQTIYFSEELDPEKDSIGYLPLDPATAFNQYSFLYSDTGKGFELSYYGLNWNHAVLCYIPMNDFLPILDSNERYIIEKMALMAFKTNPHFVWYEGYGNTKDAENYFMNKPFEVRFIPHFNGDMFWDELALFELKLYLSQQANLGNLKLYIEPGLRKPLSNKNSAAVFEQGIDSINIQYDFKRELAVINYRLKGKVQKAYWSLPMDSNATELLLAHFRRQWQ